MERYRFDVKGVCCSRYTDAIHTALSQLDGVTDIKANSETETFEVATNGMAKVRVQRAIQKMGFESAR